MSAIVDVSRPEQLELFALELEKFSGIVLSPEHNLVISSLTD